MKLILKLILLSVISFGYSEVIPFGKCEEETVECEIHQVRFFPCNNTENGKPCEVKRGKNAQIEFDFTPEFDGSYVTALAYWQNHPFPKMQSNACRFTDCPLVKGEKRTYSIQMPTHRKFPTQTFEAKFKLSTEFNVCCFMFKIKLVK